MKKISFLFFLITLIFSPLAFGTSELWSQFVVQIFISFSAIFYYFSISKKSASVFTVPGGLPLLLLLIWMALQIVPLPVALVKFLSPGAYDVYKPVYEVLGEEKWMPLSVNQKGTLLELMRIASYALFYVMTVQLLKNGEKLKKSVWIVIVAATGIALLAILQSFLTPDLLYGVRAFPKYASPFGPWVNRNQYAGFMVMLLPMVIALFLYYQPIMDAKDSFRVKLVTFFAMPGSYRQYFLGFSALIIVSSLFLSFSRGGTLATSLSLLFFFICVSFKKTRNFKWSVIIILGCVVLGATWAGLDQVIVRFDDILYEFGGDAGERVGRIPVWQDSLGIIRDFALAGSGFGTFVNTYPGYRTVIGTAIYEHAHNDYIELFSDGGLIGFILVGWLVLAVILHGWKKIRRRRDNYSVLIGIGALSGIVSMLVFSVTDFNMHNGADGLYFFFLCGLLVSAGNTRFHFRSQSTLLVKAPENRKVILLSFGTILLGLTLLVNGRTMLAKFEYNSVRNVYLSRQLSHKHLYRVAEKYHKASKKDPLEGLYPYLLGNVEEYLLRPEKARAYYLDASWKNPLNGVFLQRMALLLPENMQEKVGDLMKAGYERALYKDELLLSYAEWLLLSGQRESAVEKLRDGIHNNKKMVTKAAPMLQNHSFTRDDMAEVLSESVEVWILYGRFLEQMGDDEEAEFYLSNGLRFLENEKEIKPIWFVYVYKMHKRKKQSDKAILVLRKGVDMVPDYVPFRIWLGDYYKDEGILYRAKEEYQRAHVLDPLNEKVRVRLDNLEKRR